MDKYNIILIKNTGMSYNITKMVGALSWSDDLETLGTKLNFDIARNLDDKYLANYDIINVGDKILLNNNSEEIFRGIITNVSYAKNSKSISCFDYAFYLNQSKTVSQFYKISADKAISELCAKFNVPIGKIESMNTKINKIYKENTIAEIIKDIIQQVERESGIKYRLEMRNGKLYIIKYYEITINPVFQQSEKLNGINSLSALGDISKEENIQEMRNSILVASDDEKSSKIIATVKDQSSIETYGLLQDVINVDKKNESQAKQIANNKLKELNRISEDINIEVLGNDAFRAGRIIVINNPAYKLSGKYLIQSVTHNYTNSIHRCSLTVKGV